MKQIILLLLWLIIGCTGAVKAQSLNFNLPLSKEDAALQEREKAREAEEKHLGMLRQARYEKDEKAQKNDPIREKERELENQVLEKEFEEMRKKDLNVIGDVIMRDAPPNQ